MTTVCVEGVSKRIRGVDVLSDVSLVVRPGRVVGLAGVNGSGKTMLMRVMLGFVRPSTGSVSFDGKVMGRDIDVAPSVGALIEGPAFLPGQTGLRNLLDLAFVRGIVDEPEVCLALERVGLDPGLKLPFRAYSLGMKQRLGIACAVMEHPDVVVLDEPVNALDEQGVQMLCNLVREERERGAAVVLACHDAEVLRSLADEIWHFAEGRIWCHELLGETGGWAFESTVAGDELAAASVPASGDEVRGGRDEA